MLPKVTLFTGILIIINLVEASARNKKKADLLMDTTNSIEAVQPIQENTTKPLQNQQDSRVENQIPKASSKNTSITLRNEDNHVRNVLPKDNEATTLNSMWQSLFSWDDESTEETFKRLIEGGSYWMAGWFVILMGNNEFLEMTCSTVKTFGQYDGLVESFKNRKLVPKFFVYGNVEAVERVIAETEVYRHEDYVEGGDLETAILLAFKWNHYTRFVDLFNVRKRVTMIRDERSERGVTSFELFIHRFIYRFPLEDDMPLKRFLTLYGEVFKTKYPDIYELFCQKLVNRLSLELISPVARKFLVDFMGQPSLLTSSACAKGFLHNVNNQRCSNLLEYGWAEAIQVGLTYGRTGEGLWNKMKLKFPEQFRGEYPPSDDVLATIPNKFPTKQQLEEEWFKKNAVIPSNTIKSLAFILDLLPAALWSIITEYSISWTDT